MVNERDNQMTTDLRARVVALEQWKMTMEVTAARIDEKWTSMGKRFDDIERDIGTINDNLKWITRLIIGGIALAALAFMVGGGFKPV